MAHVASGSVVRQLGSLFEGGSVAGLSDRQLLERFTAAGATPAGEAAFAALVARHGPMVLGVCRQLLGDATMPRTPSRPSSSSWPGRPGRSATPTCWATGSTASRSARRASARGRLARRRQDEEGGTMRSGPDSCAGRADGPPADRPAIDREQAEALHGEIDRLPRAFRLPVVLCYFEGLTLDEAARRLRCPAGTVRSRLARAREKLRRGLTRRGVVLPAAALAAVLAPRSASASVSSPPVRYHDPGRDRTSRPVTPPPAGRSPPPPRPWPRRSCEPCCSTS